MDIPANRLKRFEHMQNQTRTLLGAINSPMNTLRWQNPELYEEMLSALDRYDVAALWYAMDTVDPWDGSSAADIRRDIFVAVNAA